MHQIHLHPHHYHVFHHLNECLLKKLTRYLNLAFPPFEQFANIHKYCLQLLKEKAEFIVGIVIYPKTKQA